MCDGWSLSPDTDLQHVRFRPGETPDPYLCLGTGTHYLKCHTWSTLGVKRIPVLTLEADSSGLERERGGVLVLRGLRLEEGWVLCSE